MSSKIKKHAKTLKFLTETDQATAKAIIKSARPDLVNCFTEICYNVLNGNINLTPSYKKKLAKHKKILRSIAKKSTKTSSRRNQIQKGGFLPLILPLAQRKRNVYRAHILHALNVMCDRYVVAG